VSPDPPGRADTPLVAGGAGNPARDDAFTHGPSRAGWIECSICAGIIALDDHHTARCWTDPTGTTVAAHRDCLVRVGETELSLPLPPAPGEHRAAHRGPPEP
jgi:hypothetical protein